MTSGKRITITDAPTARQQAVLDYVRAFAAREGYPPTIREIAKHFGWKSTQAVTDHLLRLEQRGLLSRPPRRSRGLHVVPARAQDVDELDGLRAEVERLRAEVADLHALLASRELLPEAR